MKRVLVFQHAPHEILGTFHPLLRAAGFRIRYANFARHEKMDIDVADYDGLILMGGPMGVYEADRYPHLHEEQRHIERAVERDMPVLGICLGAQLVAAALGAEVTPAPTKEVGWCPVELTDEGVRDPILGCLGAQETIFQWHGDTFTIPTGAAHLARSKDCASQAFRYGDKVYAFQFHLEVDEPLIDNWLDRPENQACLDELGRKTVVDKIRSDTPRFMDRQKKLSEEVFRRFIDRFSTKRRTLLPGSR